MEIHFWPIVKLGYVLFLRKNTLGRLYIENLILTVVQFSFREKS